MSHHKQREHHVRPYKILAQTIGLLVCGYFIFLLVIQGTPGIVHNRNYDLRVILPFVLIPIAGFILTWYKEGRGTTIMILGALIILAYFLFRENPVVAFTFSIPFLVVSGFFLLHLTKRSQLQRRNSDDVIH